jgi:hypothetical protein
MPKPETLITNEDRYQCYMMGWGDGAGPEPSRPAPHPELSKAYRAGYLAGDQARRDASGVAVAMYPFATLHLVNRTSSQEGTDEPPDEVG